MDSKSDQNVPPPLPERRRRSDQNNPPPVPERPRTNDRNNPPPLPERPWRSDQNNPPPVPERPWKSDQNVCRDWRFDQKLRSHSAIRKWLRDHDVRPMKRVETSSRRARCLKRVSKPMVTVVLLLLLGGVIAMSVRLRRIRGGTNKGMTITGTYINII